MRLKLLFRTLLITGFFLVAAFIQRNSHPIGLYFSDGYLTKEDMQQRLTAILNDTMNHTEMYRPGDDIPTYDELYLKHKAIPRPLSLSLFKTSIQLLSEVTDILTQHNISFIMAQGTLMGSYLFHSFIPWDDDMDLFVDITHINKLRAVFRTKQFKKTFGVISFHEPDGINMYAPDKLSEDIPLSNTHSCGKHKTTKKCHQQCKVYYHTSPHAGKYTWKYPFVDIFFTYRNGLYIYNHEKHGNIKVIKVAADDIHPVVLRPLHNLWLPAPRNTKAFLQADYKKFQCKRSHWDHQHEKMYKKVLKAPCKTLTDHYPYVRRRPLMDDLGNIIQGQVIEDLILGDTVIHTLLLNQSYYKPDILQFQ